MAYALVMGNLPRWLRPVTLTFAGVASNFAGVPLAFAFISTLGRTGFITVLARESLASTSTGPVSASTAFWA